jgi:2-hydroxy-6-oxonona-2,4-dienedioate hydrolase
LRNDQDLKEKFETVGGIKTRYFESGKGSPLVLIHGGQYGSYDNACAWALNIQELAKKFHVYAFDKFGMGYTDGPSGENGFTMQATIDHANSFLDKLGMDRTNLVGHSRGAFVAARISLLSPNRIASLTVVDSNTLAPDDPSAPHDFYAKLEQKGKTPETRKSAIREVEANSYSKSHITREMREEWFRVARLPAIISIRERFAQSARNQIPDLKLLKGNTLKEIDSGKLKVPALIVWGYNDPSAPVTLGYRLFEIISKSVLKSQLHVFNKAGHYVFREQASGFNQVLANFLQTF